MTCTVASGGQSQLLIKQGTPAYNWETGTRLRPRFAATDLGKDRRIIEFPTITGKRGVYSDNTREGIGFANGTIVMSLNPFEMDLLAPLILGTNESPTGTFSPTLELPWFGVLVDRGYGVFEYQCKVESCRIHGRAPVYNEQGSPEMMIVELMVVALDEDDSKSWPAAPPALGSGLAAEAMTFTDLVVNLEGGNRNISALDIRIRNFLEVTYVNSVTALDICAQDLSWVGGIRMPWTSDNFTNLFQAAFADAAATFTWTNSTVSTQFSLPNARLIAKAPPIRGKRGLFSDLQVRGYLNGADELVQIVNDDVV